MRKIKTLPQLVKAIAKAEGKKSQVSVGNIREILKIIVRIEADSCARGDLDGGPVEVLCNYTNQILRRRRGKGKKK